MTLKKKLGKIAFRGGAWRDAKGHFVSKAEVKRRRKKWKRKEIKVKVALPPPPKFMWRITLAVNFVSHHKYYALRLQRWAESLDELRLHEKRLEEKLIRNLESRLGFGRENWWFPYQVGMGWQVVPYNHLLINHEEIALEYLREKRRGK